MIIDNLSNSHQYRQTHKGFAEAFSFLEKAVEEKLPAGRYEIDGDRVFAFIQEYTSKTESSFEGHKNYIDIQFIVEGTEVIYAADISPMTVKEEYSAERDVMFLEDCEKATMAVLQAGEYGIFFPWDAHKPGLCYGGNPDTVRKIVVKVRAD
jgi:YhcH/YjgK/YiaL family protein